MNRPPGYLGHRKTHRLLSQEVLKQYHTETVKLSFVLFDEIEKASDALRNFLLGILDKAALTLGDTRNVDSSRAMIFMTSNLGASEMRTISFSAHVARENANLGTIDATMTAGLSRTGMEAACKKFTPEFSSRSMARFRCLAPYFRSVPSSNRNVLLASDKVKTNGRSFAVLKIRIATDQVRGGDWIRVDFDNGTRSLRFVKEAEGLTVQDMIRLVDASVTIRWTALSQAA